jgi:glyoxylate utilization-related uncharacterized protein
MKLPRCASIALLLGLVGTIPAWSDDATATIAKDRVWSKSDVVAGAQESAVWGSAGSANQGVLIRWPSRAKAKSATSGAALNILVLTGTFTVEWGGQYRELGPGGVVQIPHGLTHTLGCEAAGECMFLVHRIVEAAAKNP